MQLTSVSLKKKHASKPRVTAMWKIQLHGRRSVSLVALGCHAQGRTGSCRGKTTHPTSRFHSPGDWTQVEAPQTWDCVDGYYSSDPNNPGRGAAGPGTRSFAQENSFGFQDANMENRELVQRASWFAHCQTCCMSRLSQQSTGTS